MWDLSDEEQKLYLSSYWIILLESLEYKLLTNPYYVILTERKEHLYNSQNITLQSYTIEWITTYIHYLLYSKNISKDLEEIFKYIDTYIYVNKDALYCSIIGTHWINKIQHKLLKKGLQEDDIYKVIKVFSEDNKWTKITPNTKFDILLLLYDFYHTYGNEGGEQTMYIYTYIKEHFEKDYPHVKEHTIELDQKKSIAKKYLFLAETTSQTQDNRMFYFQVLIRLLTTAKNKAQQDEYIIQAMECLHSHYQEIIHEDDFYQYLHTERLIDAWKKNVYISYSNNIELDNKFVYQDIILPKYQNHTFKEEKLDILNIQNALKIDKKIFCNEINDILTWLVSHVRYAVFSKDMKCMINHWFDDDAIFFYELIKDSASTVGKRSNFSYNEWTPIQHITDIISDKPFSDSLSYTSFEENYHEYFILIDKGDKKRDHFSEDVLYNIFSPLLQKYILYTQEEITEQEKKKNAEYINMIIGSYISDLSIGDRIHILGNLQNLNKNIAVGLYGLMRHIEEQPSYTPRIYEYTSFFLEHMSEHINTDDQEKLITTSLLLNKMHKISYDIADRQEILHFIPRDQKTHIIQNAISALLCLYETHLKEGFIYKKEQWNAYCKTIYWWC